MPPGAWRKNANGRGKGIGPARRPAGGSAAGSIPPAAGWRARGGRRGRIVERRMPPGAWRYNANERGKGIGPARRPAGGSAAGSDTARGRRARPGRRRGRIAERRMPPGAWSKNANGRGKGIGPADRPAGGSAAGSDTARGPEGVRRRKGPRFRRRARVPSVRPRGPRERLAARGRRSEKEARAGAGADRARLRARGAPAALGSGLFVSELLDRESQGRADAPRTTAGSPRNSSSGACGCGARSTGRSNSRPGGRWGASRGN